MSLKKSIIDISVINVIRDLIKELLTNDGKIHVFKAGSSFLKGYNNYQNLPRSSGLDFSSFCLNEKAAPLSDR